MPISLGTTTITALYLGTTSITSAYLGATQVFGGSFTPLDLFSGGAQGIWLDPSDLSTMFQDLASTTPVTTPGQPVGRRLDKSGRGNHATAPTLAARPIYGVEPKGGRRNLLTYSEAFNESVWIKLNGSITSTSETAPDGTATADKFTENTATGGHRLRQGAASYVSGSSYTFSVYAKAAERSVIVFDLPSSAFLAATVWFNLAATAVSKTSGATVTSSITGVGSGWFRLSVTASCTTTATSNVDFYLDASPTGTTSYTGDGTSGILIWGAQLELGSTATNYQRVTTAYDVTESGVATCHYVQYDGSDDSLSTSAIDFTATDKMSVFAGVRKLSDAAQGVVVELSATVASNSGSFLLAAPDGATATFGFDSKGTVQVDAVASSLTAPISRIVTGLADIAGDRATIRIDGVQADQDTGDQGTGNYGNYSMFIGRRNNATLPFNGRDFGIIVVGKTASAGEIADTETWLAARTAQVTI